MEEEYMEQDLVDSVNRNSDGNDNIGDTPKEFGEPGYDENYEDDDGSNNFRNNRGRGNFRGGRGRGPPPGWGGGPPMRFRGRGYGPGGPPMRGGRGFFRGRGGPRFGAGGPGPAFDNNWGPMGPPPPGMMGGPPPFGPPPGMMPPSGPMGPPPNMMQPPFGGPPGMPPNMPGPELWVETKSDEGKSYYYHARTRETTWTRPQEGPACKVITQAEMEAMAAAGQMPSVGGPQTMPMNGPMGGPPMGGPPMGGPPMGGPPMGGPPMGGPPMGGPPMGMPPMGGMPMGSMMQQNSGGLPPFMSQPPPWVKDGGNKQEKQSDNDSQSDNDDLPPGETAPSQVNGGGVCFPGALEPAFPGAQFPAPAFPPHNQAHTQPPPFAQGGGPPVSGSFPGGGGGAWGGWPGWPPLVAQPPPSLASAAVPNAGAATQLPPPIITTPEPVVVVETPPKKEETVIPAELITRAGEWTAHSAPDGRPYYYCAATQESIWEKPQPMRELEELQARINAERGEKLKHDKEIDEKAEVIDVDAHAEAAAAAEAERRADAERRAAAERDRADRERQEKERQDRERQEKERQEKEKLEKEKAKQDRSRPISSTPISGTPWCVVWTGDGRVFFYNPTAHSSVWERPPQLAGRADVDKAVSEPPDALLHLQRKEAAANAKATNGELKRTAGAGAPDSSSDESEPEPAKRPKPEEVGKKPPGGAKIDAGAEAAIEAEVRAARERAVVPLEQRMRAFRDMLEESRVSAFSPWEKELHKIVFDARYLLLTSKERKQVFDKYVRERAEEERKEKKNRILQKKAAFRALMDDAKLHSKSSFTEFSSKHGRDERFKGIDKPRDRETYFNEYLSEVRKREKDDKERKREQAKSEFIALLKEKAVDRRARWADAKKKVDTEPKYKAVESSALREDYFREYCRILKEERKKEKEDKEKDRERSKKDKKERDKDRDKDKEKERDGKEGKKEKKKEKESESSPVPSEAADSDSNPEEGAESPRAAAARREARAQASIKEREREVQRALANSLRDRDKEREYHKRDEAVQHFNALLADLVRNPDLPWREAKKQLKKDHRYNLAENLSKEDKERLFTQHISLISGKRRDKLRAILDELRVPSTAHWRDVRAKLRHDQHAPAYASAAQMEREFRDYQRDKQSSAKTALRQLLLETRCITHKSRALAQESELAMQAVHDAIKHDARYTALDHIPEERDVIITGYLEELDKKGPPPPPTATEPSRRAKQ